MPNGKINLETERGVNVTLLDAVAAPADGVWIDTFEYEVGSLDVTLSATATVQIRGSDAFVRPADATHGNQIGADQTASAQLAVVYLSRWLKARVTATTGTVTVNGTFRYAPKK